MTFAAWVFLLAALTFGFFLVCVLVAFHDRMNDLERRLPIYHDDTDLPRRGTR